MNGLKREKHLFEEAPMAEAILSLAMPAVMGQIILVIYNMADTFFVGLTGSDAMITAVTVCMPAFMFLSAIANLFGVGGASVIARALGNKNAVLVKDNGAVCVAGNQYDAEAVELVMEKACKTAVGAELYGDVKPLSALDSNLMRIIYKLKYSKKAGK